MKRRKRFTSLEDAFSSARKSWLINIANPGQEHAARFVFYGGAMAALEVILAGDPEHVEQTIERLMDEIKNYWASLAAAAEADREPR